MGDYTGENYRSLDYNSYGGFQDSGSLFRPILEDSSVLGCIRSPLEKSDYSLGGLHNHVGPH